MWNNSGLLVLGGSQSMLLLRMGLRGALLLLGVACVTWSGVLLPHLPLAAMARDVTARILADDRLKLATLNETLKILKVHARPVFERSDVTRAVSLVWLRLEAEPSASKSSAEADHQLSVTQDRLVGALSLNPNDSWLWLMVYSVRMSRIGFDVGAVRYLTQSYDTAPLEGWIALRRNRLALAAFPSLGEVMRVKVVSEFAAMVDSDFTEATVSNLVGIGWEQRYKLVSRLADVNIISREKFARLLAREGVMLSVPGVQLDERLWRQ